MLSQLQSPEAAPHKGSSTDRGDRGRLLDCSAAVKTLGRRSEWQKALWLAAQLVKSNVPGEDSGWFGGSDVVLQNLLISACQRAQQWPKALQLLRDLHGVPAISSTVVSYNAAISACGKGAWQAREVREGFSQVAILLADQTVQKDVITFNSLMSSLDLGLSWQCAPQILANLRCSALRPTVVTCSTAMSLVDWARALQFLATEQTDVEWRQALRVLGACKDCQLQPHVVAYNAVISAVVQRRWQFALRIFEEVITYNAAMSACETQGLWQRALVLLDDMASMASMASLQPDVVSFATALSACEKAEEWQQAIELLVKLRGASLKEDAVTCSALASACVKGEEWALALWFIAEMKNIQRDVFVYTAAMGAYEKRDHWNRALLVFDDLLRSSLEVDLVAKNAIITACAWKVGMALLGKELAACDEISYNSLLAACAKEEKTRQAGGTDSCIAAG
eukprot:Skav230081  [mRNA]  locus=scaffold2569:265953:269109:- [translate_table: standard]